MLAASLSNLGATDGLCLLLPAQWLEADYATSIRELLWGSRDRRVEIHLFDSRLFSDAQVDAVALFVGSKRSIPQPVSIGRATSLNGIVNSKVEQLDRNAPTPRNWRRIFDRTEKVSTRVPGRRTTTLGHLAQLRRGVATGSNWFFTLSAVDQKKWGLPTEALRQYAHRARDFVDDGVVTQDSLEKLPTTRKRYMLVVTDTLATSPAVSEYLEQGRELGAHETYLASKRDPWWDFSTEARSPDLIVGASATQEFAVLDNEARAVITNNLYGLYWKDGVDDSQRQAALVWLRSSDGQAAIWSKARVQAGGLRKIELRELASLEIPQETPRAKEQEPGLGLPS
jgi:hypothetical protein